MPIYEYRCKSCDASFEVVRPMRDRDDTRSVACPRCGAGQTERCPSRVSVETNSKGYHPAKPLDV